ncbi:MAG TPA: hypothetical protein VN969_22385 [Streptosporangiaceae bacterium]|nr:hypothetical protein [Streptosporangiaceae bacterium]
MTSAGGARTVLDLARAEASLLVRSLLVLAGLLASGAVVWVLFGSVQPLWWNAAWQIGFGQLILGLVVLAAAQLAAGRARREGMADLYTSFPVTAGTRTVAHLASLAGAAPASLLLTGAAAAVVQARGAIGTPAITVLASGLVLVIASGAAGIAIGTRFSHPLAGVLGALALFITATTSHLVSGAAIWLVPWEWNQDQLSGLPGPLAGYPPAGAHLLELAGLAVLAGTVALAVTAGHVRARGALATAGIVALAVTCLAGALQLRPIPTAGLDHLVTETASLASVQHCTTANDIRYCLYPEFGRDLPSLEEPVNGVLARLPARPSHPLRVQQVLTLDLTDLTYGHSKDQISQWRAQLRNARASALTDTAIYLPVGSWPAGGSQLTDANFAVALTTAEWGVRIPAQATGNPASEQFLPCVPLNQAREAIAIWLAILATRPSAGELQAGLSSGGHYLGDEVSNTFVPTWTYPGMTAGYLASSGFAPQPTAAGYLLAAAMVSLPQQKVSHVLASAWGRWLNWHTTDAQLAAALGIPMPSISTLVPPPPPGQTTGHGPGTGPQSPQSPLCTS